MAKKASLKKARQTKERNLRNRKTSKAFKTAIRKLELAIKDKKSEQELRVLFTKAVSLIDKAAAKRVIHKNNAARKKSLINRKLRNYLTGNPKKQ